MILLDNESKLERDSLNVLINAARDVAKLPGVRSVVIGLDPTSSASSMKFSLEVGCCGGDSNGR